MTDAQPRTASPDEQLRYLEYELAEGQRRTGSGHMRTNFLGAMTLGVLALYGAAWVAPTRLPWWGPLGSIVIALCAFSLLLWVSRPHLNLGTIVRGVIWLPRTEPAAGATYLRAESVTAEALRKMMADDVDFYNWGIPRREIQLVRCAILLVCSFLPLLGSGLIQHW